YDQLGPAREDGVSSRRGLAVDRKDARAERPLRISDGLAADATAFSNSRRKARQRTVALGELQPAEARGVDACGGIGRSRVPRQRQDRAIRKVLFDFVRERSVELAQDD